MKSPWLPIGVALLLSACTTQTTVIRADFTERAGVYVVGYSADPTIRHPIEDQLVTDLTTRDMTAFASHADIPDITASNRDQLLDMANTKRAIGVLLINQVASDASDSVVENPQRVSPRHPDLRAFYAYTQENQPAPPGEDQTVLAEVNLFIVDDDEANLYWSGTTWSFQADGKGTAIRDISALVADQLQQVSKNARATAFDR